jgi:DNA-binding CsgD family transcriptional regulator
MATQALSARKVPSAKSTVPTPAELIRLLVNHANAAEVGDPQFEEVILNADLDGARYLLIRLPKSDRPKTQLSPREQEIVRMVANGHSNKVIADVLSISSWTVCTHLRRIFAKLGVGSRAAMVARLLETGGMTRNPSSTPSRNSPAPLGRIARIGN